MTNPQELIERRTLLANALTMAGTTFFGAASCSPAESAKVIETRADPRLALYHIPPEDAPHERTFMQWPVSLNVYDRASLAAVQANIASIANAIPSSGQNPKIFG